MRDSLSWFKISLSEDTHRLFLGVNSYFEVLLETLFVLVFVEAADCLSWKSSI